MAGMIQTTINKITLLLLFSLCLGCSSTLYAAQNDEVDDEKQENTDPNAPHGPQNDKKQIVASWACPKCTFLNKANSKCCEICNANKPLPDKKHSIWTCSVCTLENSIDNTKCTACNSPHPLSIQHIAPKQDHNKLVKYSPVDVKFISHEVKKDDNTTVVCYRFKVMYNSSACEISCTDTSLRGLHQDIIKTGDINAKSLMLLSENTSKNSIKHGKRLQSYLLSLFKHDKTDDEEILCKLGLWICDICKLLNDLNKKCIKCKSEQITIKVRAGENGRSSRKYTISITYTSSILLAYVFDKAIQYMNNKYYKRYCIISTDFDSFIGKSLGNKIKSTDNLEWDKLVKQKITSWSKDEIIKKGLKIKIFNSYHHSPSATKISCKHISNVGQSKYSGLGLAFQCPIYHDAKKHYIFSKDALLHLYFTSHFLDEYREKPVCRHGLECKSFTRLEHNGHLIKDLCHIKLYRHPPRNSRQIQLNNNIYQFICTQNEDHNKPLYRLTNTEEKKLFRLLLDEVIKNGYKYDLCLICTKEDKCNHDVYQKNKNTLISIIKDKFKHYRYKKMGRPFHWNGYNPDALMLSLILYTGGDCNYDMCAVQRSGDYDKWKIFDYCLYSAIKVLSAREYGSYKLYSGLKKTKLSKIIIRSGYFPTYTSTTPYKDIAKKFMRRESGMIIEIDQAVRNAFICCDVSWISKFPDEYEIVVARTIKKKLGKIDNNFSVKILDDRKEVQTVLLTTNQGDIIPKIACMIRGEYPLYKVTSLDKSVFDKLVAGASDVPVHIKETWDKFSNKQQRITIDMQKMYRYYKAFIPPLFDQKLLLLDKLVQLFPNVTEIICTATDNITGRQKRKDYSAAIVCSNFILGVKDRLSKLDKKAKLTKILIQTYEHEIGDDCKLYATQFGALGWEIGKGADTIALTKTAYDDCIAKISSMLQGKYLKNDEATSLDGPIFNKLISGANDLPTDVQKQWNELRHKQQRITIDIRFMYEYYKAFIPLFFDKNCQNLLLMDKIVQLFPNVTEIICNNTNYIKYGKYLIDYSADIVCSKFMLGVKKRLSKLDKQAKLTKILIQTEIKFVKDSCNLYPTQFGALGWRIGKGCGGKTIIVTKESYDVMYKDVIPKISAMLHGEELSNDIPPSLDVPIFKQLINHDKDVPADVQKEWNAFRKEQQRITIDMRYMYWYYKAFMPLLFDPKCKNLLLLDKIAQLFPNVTEMICKRTDYVGRKAKEYNPNQRGYSSAIVNSTFILGVKIDKNSKLTKIVIQTYAYKIGDDCKLYTARFLTLGWQIQKGSYDSWGNAKKNNQITLTRLQAPKASFPNGALASTDTNENKPNDHQPADEVFDID